jgi:hypothetical protein
VEKKVDRMVDTTPFVWRRGLLECADHPPPAATQRTADERGQDARQGANAGLVLAKGK